jgi:hypothetical protein
MLLVDSGGERKGIERRTAAHLQFGNGCALVERHASISSGTRQRRS